MAQPRQSLKVTHRAKTFEDHIIHANMALRDGNPGEAICYYDRVLYELSPGHICALLNRCLAYIESGHPELAVMDAYRAKIAASELREVRPCALSIRGFEFSLGKILPWMLDLQLGNIVWGWLPFPILVL